MTELTPEQAANRAAALLCPGILRDEVRERYPLKFVRSRASSSSSARSKALRALWEFVVAKYGEPDDDMHELARAAGVLSALWYAAGSAGPQEMHARVARWELSADVGGP